MYELDLLEGFWDSGSDVLEELCARPLKHHVPCRTTQDAPDVPLDRLAPRNRGNDRVRTGYAQAPATAADAALACRLARRCGPDASPTPGPDAGSHRFGAPSVAA